MTQTKDNYKGKNDEVEDSYADACGNEQDGGSIHYSTMVGWIGYHVGEKREAYLKLKLNKN